MKPAFAKGKAFGYGLVTLFVVNLIVIPIAGEDPRVREAVWAVAPALKMTSAYSDAWNKFIYDLNLGSAISLFFFWLVVRAPEYQRRARLKRSFKAEYNSFRVDCIEIFLLLADGSYSGDLPETLLTQKAFREYFKGNVQDNQDRWDRVADKLKGYYLQRLLARMEQFREEIVFVLNNVDIESDEALAFLKRYSKAMWSASVGTPGYDNKPLLQLLWAIFSGWSFITGYPETDIIEDMIREL